MQLIELRCDGVRMSGPHMGVACRVLLCKVDVSTIGAVETKCVRCNRVRLWQFTGAMVAVSS